MGPPLRGGGTTWRDNTPFHLNRDFAILAILCITLVNISLQAAVVICKALQEKREETLTRYSVELCTILTNINQVHATSHYESVLTVTHVQGH